MVEIEITESDLLKAIQEAWSADPGSGDGFMTTEEIALELDWPSRRVQRVLRILMDQGRLQRGRKMRKNIAGHFYPVTTYRVITDDDDGDDADE